jgi:hypothetical protein
MFGTVSDAQALWRLARRYVNDGLSLGGCVQEQFGVALGHCPMDGGDGGAARPVCHRELILVSATIEGHVRHCVSPGGLERQSCSLDWYVHSHRSISGRQISLPLVK